MVTRRERPLADPERRRRSAVQRRAPGRSPRCPARRAPRTPPRCRRAVRRSPAAGHVRQPPGTIRPGGHPRRPGVTAGRPTGQPVSTVTGPRAPVTADVRRTAPPGSSGTRLGVARTPRAVSRRVQAGGRVARPGRPRRPGGRRRRRRTRRAGAPGPAGRTPRARSGGPPRERAPPPTRSTRSTVAPCGDQRVEAVGERAEHALDRRPGQVRRGRTVRRVRPCTAPVACGRFGVRSPSRYGTRTSPSAPAGRTAPARTARRGRRRAAPAAASSTRAALSVHDQRQEPAGGVGEAGDRAARVVGGRRRRTRRPCRRCRSRRPRRPGRRRPRAPAAALSPVPGPSGGTVGQARRRAGRAEHRGHARCARPKPSSSRSRR